MPKHIFRLICLLLGVLAVAFIAPRILAVDSFYKFGHYRANSVVEIAAKDPAYQTATYCLSCQARRPVVGQRPQVSHLRSVSRCSRRPSREGQAADPQGHGEVVYLVSR